MEKDIQILEQALTQLMAQKATLLEQLEEIDKRRLGVRAQLAAMQRIKEQQEAEKQEDGSNDADAS